MKFIERLESLNANNRKVRADLRRSLAFAPGAFAHAIRYVEPFVNDEDNAWRREMFYLVAGLWAMHWREGRRGQPMSIGQACAAYQISSNSKNVENRFINLLDADPDQLPHRMRQIISLLKDQTIDFDDLLKGLLYWKDDKKRTQKDWARKFYRKIKSETDAITDEESEKNEDFN